MMGLVSLVLYCSAVAVGLVLFMLFKPKEEDKERRPSEESMTQVWERAEPSLLALLGLKDNALTRFFAFEDHFHTFREVSRACKRAGLEACNLIIGVDFTASNEWQGRKTFGGNNLHKIIPGKVYNPYQKVISILGETLEPFDDDRLIPAYGFGDTTTLGHSVFPFITDEKQCFGFMEVLDRYNFLAKKVTLSGPTNFAPLIHKAIDIVKTKGTFHILIIIADGQVNEEAPTVEAIVEASNYPLSIVVVGVGDGPWDTMEEFDNQLPKRKFDNFQFVNYHRVISKSKSPDTTFALHALMEIPDQYKTIKSLGYLDSDKPTKESSEIKQRRAFNEASI